MFDLKLLAGEVQHARLARIRAQREGCSIDGLIHLMRQSARVSCRLELAMRHDDAVPEEDAASAR